MRTMILGYQNKPGVEDAVRQLRPAIALSAEIVVEDLTGEMDLSGFDADFAIVFGGDGSILRAIKRLGRRQIPVIAVNLGRLGFLANVSKYEVADMLPILQEQMILMGPNWADEMLEGHALGRSNRNHFTVSEHRLLICSVTHKGETETTFVVNEVAVQNATFHIMEVRLSINGEFVTTYHCDGLILSTAVGSTAHNLSAGGPILRQNLDSIVISPIAPHTLTYRPVVDSALRTYQMEACSRDKAPCFVVVDGTVFRQITSEDLVEVTPSDVCFRMINPPGYSYYSNLQQKLGWSGHANIGD